MKFCERIKQARTEAHLTQTEVSDRLSLLGFSIKPYVISSWEIGKHKPDLEQFAALCKLYHADADYLLTGNKSNSPLLSGLNDKGRDHVLHYLTFLKSDPVFTEEEPKKKCFTFRLLDIPVSAGTGQHLDSSDYTELTTEKELPRGTDYAVRVKGDSMEPNYTDGQILFIKTQNALDNGEIGIFSLNGEVYVKKLLSDKLISLNKNYQPIPLLESDEFHIFGKVLGAL